ncbi:MAG: hypothetical protein OEU26_10630, partial [Candidatus Tectomicrobia bacterium]|nr:hypothetical protein [Candidatus Tectomicrobia bacterium]
SWLLTGALFIVAGICAYTVGDAGALTLTNPGTDITPAGAKDIAEGTLSVLVNYLAPLGGLGMLLTAGASFARNRQSGITAGPGSLGVGGVAMVFSPMITSQLMTTAGETATLIPGLDPYVMMSSPSPVFIAAVFVTRYLRRR